MGPGAPHLSRVVGTSSRTERGPKVKMRERKGAGHLSRARGPERRVGTPLHLAHGAHRKKRSARGPPGRRSGKAQETSEISLVSPSLSLSLGSQLPCLAAPGVAPGARPAQQPVRPRGLGPPRRGASCPVGWWGCSPQRGGKCVGIQPESSAQLLLAS